MSMPATSGLASEPPGRNQIASPDFTMSDGSAPTTAHCGSACFGDDVGQVTGELIYLVQQRDGFVVCAFTIRAYRCLQMLNLNERHESERLRYSRPDHRRQLNVPSTKVRTRAGSMISAYSAKPSAAVAVLDVNRHCGRVVVLAAGYEHKARRVTGLHNDLALVPQIGDAQA